MPALNYLIYNNSIENEFLKKAFKCKGIRHNFTKNFTLAEKATAYIFVDWVNYSTFLRSKSCGAQEAIKFSIEV